MAKSLQWPLLTEQQSALGIAAFFTGVGIGHFARPQFFEAVVPDWVPDKATANRVSGAAEIVLGVAMIPRATRRAAAVGLLGLLAAVFPANIDMAINDVDISPTGDGGVERVVGGVSDARNWIRLPFQFLFRGLGMAPRSSPPVNQDCPTCDRVTPRGPWRAARQLVPAVRRRLGDGHPDWSAEEPVCHDCVRRAEAAEMRSLLVDTGVEMDDEAEAVLASIRDDSLITSETEDDFEEIDQRHKLAARLVPIIGNWTVVAAIGGFLAAWVLWNVIARPFEPYPIIVLAVISAVLASVAAIEGPIILMSQRSQRERDRLRARADYRVNLKAELEIQYLDQKVDLLLQNQREPGA